MSEPKSIESETPAAVAGAAPCSAKYVPFTIICPEIKPGQGIKTREISVEVREEYGEDILTAEAMTLIETIKMQMMLTRLTECVRELYANSPNDQAEASGA